MTRSPDETTVRGFISSQKDLPFTYSEVGASRTAAPAGYVVDHNRQLLGHGESTYQRAVAALRHWKQFDLGWVKIVPAESIIEVGNTVAIQARTLGLWSLNACRIVYLIEDEDDANCKARFGFAYGTLPAHVECGEERFTIEWHQDDSVWYDLYAFSRPQYPLVKLGYPYARGLQKRFARQSLTAMALASS